MFGREWLEGIPVVLERHEIMSSEGMKIYAYKIRTKVMRIASIVKGGQKMKSFGPHVHQSGTSVWIQDVHGKVR
jgi:hypothetical protein